LLAFGTVRQIGSSATIRAMLGGIAEAVHETMDELRRHIRAHPAFAEIGARMLAQWDEGIRTSLVE
jgi:serine/threonine-protein kinase HipA